MENTNFEAVAEMILHDAEKAERVITLGRALRAIGSVDQATRESKARLDAMRADEAAKRAELVELSGQVQAAREHSESAIAQAHTTGDQIVAAAYARAKELDAEAEDKALAVLARAQNEGQALISRAQSQAALANEQRIAAQSAVADARAQLAALNDELKATQTKLDTAKAHIAHLFGKPE